MATSRGITSRTAAIVAAFAVLAWIGVEIGRAGSDVSLVHVSATSTLQHGVLSGKRIDGRAWTMDYDTVSMSPDASVATIAHVRNGRIHRPGRPDIRLQADGVTINTVTNDLTIRGPVRFVDPLTGGRERTLTTDGAQYVGATQTLVLDHPVTIVQSGVTVTVANVHIDFRSGAATFGRIVATRPGTAP